MEGTSSKILITVANVVGLRKRKGQVCRIVIADLAFWSIACESGSEVHTRIQGYFIRIDKIKCYFRPKSVIFEIFEFSDLGWFRNVARSIPGLLDAL